MSRDERLERVFLGGWMAAVLGRPASDNPHTLFDEGVAWSLGWHSAQEDPIPAEVLEQATIAALPAVCLEQPEAA